MNEAQALELIRDALSEVVADRASEFGDLRVELTIEELSLDSVQTMELVGVLEERLDTTFPDEELPHVNSIGDIASLVLHGKVHA